MTDRNDAQIFESTRPMLMGLAYRILGSRADAEDAVQDTFARWHAADKSGIDNPSSWLTTVCTRRCLDLLRSAHRARTDYIGPWLPEPIEAAADDTEHALLLAESLSTAFLLMLERLTPKERAAFLLHDIFDVPYAEIARTLGIEEAACRKLVSRARANVDRAKVRHVTPVARQEELLAAFLSALTDGTTDRLAALLSDDVTLAADSGGRVPALLDVLLGRDEVLVFVANSLRGYWSACDRVVLDLNGTRGLLLEENGRTIAAVSFAYDEDGNAMGVYIMRNPETLAHLGKAQ